MKQLHLAYYCTGHGLGHATRIVEVATWVASIGHRVTICSGADIKPLLAAGQCSILLRHIVLDCGSVQADPFSVDMRASLEAYHTFAVQGRQKLLDGESSWLTANHVDLVVSDTVPLACAAAHVAKLPAVVCSNFSWDLIYSEYLTECGSGNEEGASWRSMVWQIAEDFARATLLRLPGFCPMPAFGHVIDVPLIARPPRLSSHEVRRQLSLQDDEKMALLMYGGQPAGLWQLRASALPPGWRCVVCSGGKQVGSTQLPDNFVLAAADAYTPDLVAAADCVVGKIGYLPSITVSFPCPSLPGLHNESSLVAQHIWHCLQFAYNSTYINIHHIYAYICV